LIDTCQRCGKCVEACPRDAIFSLDESFGPAAGTPVIVARQAPCVVCEGLQCTQVCPSGALRKIAVFDVSMGTAVVEPERCVTWADEECAMCVTQCPVPGAIAQVEGHPVVDAARCIGCGVCEHVCPTERASITVQLPL
jgi:ferredoxin-type protein NapG